jgi:DNA polymerase I-like protein with 3'-5' exonuclease and polymerase domains
MSTRSYLALDTETVGISTHHGNRPYFVTTCDGEGAQWYCRWAVNPLTREVQVEEADILVIRQLISNYDHLIFHNSRFDISMLAAVGVEVPWSKVQDTLAAAHVLASMEPHDLTYTVRKYLKQDIRPYEEKIGKITKSARSIVQQARLRIKKGREENGREKYADWRIAHEDLPEMPSAGKEDWRADMWLPAAIAEDDPELFDTEEERGEWLTALPEYANTDSASTAALWTVLEAKLHRRKKWDQYLSRMAVLPVAYKMEHRGVTVSVSVASEQRTAFEKESIRLGKICMSIAEVKDYDLELPKSGRNKSLDTFAFDVLRLPVLSSSDKTGRPAFDADAKERYELELPRNTIGQKFIESLNAKAKYDTALSYLDGYERFWIPEKNHEGWARLHPSINPCGTRTLQWSSNNPNSQNMSKKSAANLRKAICPLPGRVLVSMDAQNIQLRIPAYEAGEKELTDVFDHPEQGPYYGSYHLVIFDTLHPEKFKQHGKDCKTLFEDAEYQWVKNGNFARQFGAMERKVDATYRVQGGYRRIGQRFPKIDRLSKNYIAAAERYGYVETLRGYPLQCKKYPYEEVSPTIPFCYHVAGSAQEWLAAGMVEVEETLVQWRSKGFDAWQILSVHDEVVFDMPLVDESELKERILSLKKILEEQGKKINIPTPITAEIHYESWAKGVVI